MIYEYECSLGHRTEVLKMRPEPDKTVSCPECNKEAKRVFSAPAIVTTGGGFDETIGHFSSNRDKHEKMRLFGVSPKDGCGSLTKVRPVFNKEDVRVHHGIKEGGI